MILFICLFIFLKFPCIEFFVYFLICSAFQHLLHPVIRSSNTCVLTIRTIIFGFFWTCHMLISCCDSCLLASTGKVCSASNDKRVEATVWEQIRMVIYFTSRQDKTDWYHVKWKSQSCHTSQKTENFIHLSGGVVPRDLSQDCFWKDFASPLKTGKVWLKIDLRCKNKKDFKCTSIDCIEYRR